MLNYFTQRLVRKFVNAKIDQEVNKAVYGQNNSNPIVSPPTVPPITSVPVPPPSPVVPVSVGRIKYDDFTKVEINKKTIDIKIIQGKLQADFPDLGSDLFDIAIKALSSDSNEFKQKLLWSTAYKLSEKENGKFELDKLREALGYKIGWTEIVWNKVRERNGRKV
jgi:hypothetical protein